MPTPFASFSSLSLSKSGRNVANPEAAKLFAQRLVKDRLCLIEGPRARSIERWVETAARKSWIKTAPSVPISEDEAAAMRDSGKLWAMPAFASGNLVRIELGEEAWQEAMGIVDFLLANDGERLAHLGFEAAAQKAKQWHDSLARAKAAEEDPDGIEPYADAGDGMLWVEVTSAASLLREGALMRHCVGSYAKQVQSSACKIFSLRDVKNQPHLTVEVNALNGNEDQIVFGDDAVAAQISQIRGKANRMPGRAHAGALRALAAELAKRGLPLQKASELASTGLELRADTGELALFEELEDGYLFKGPIMLSGRIPVGLERFSFESSLTISSALLPASLSVDALALVLDGCSGPEISIKNRRPQGKLTVLGVNRFGSASFDASRVDLVGLSAKGNWQNIQGLSVRARSMVGAVLGIGARPSKISISAADGLAQGVLARRLEITTPSADSGRYVAERCSFESKELSEGVFLVGCMQAGKALPAVSPQSDLFVQNSQVGDFVENLIDFTPTSKLSNALAILARREAPRKAKALGALSEHVGAVDSIWMRSYPAGMEMMAIQGNLVAFSIRELARREFERLSLAYGAISALPLGEGWAAALFGELDPEDVPAREEGGPFMGRRFSLADWAAEFKARFPSLAADFVEGKGLGIDQNDSLDPEVREMLMPLARGCVKLDGAQAHELWRMAGGLGAAESFNFFTEAEHGELAEHGPWRSVASLGFAAMPTGDDEAPNEDVVLLDSVLGKAIAKLNDCVSSVALGHNGPVDYAEAIEDRIISIGVMALLWPLADVDVVCPEPPPASTLAAACERQASMTPFAAAAMGAATAKGLGDMSQAPALAAHWARLIGSVFKDSQTETYASFASEIVADIRDYGSMPGASIMGEAASRNGTELAAWEAENSSIAALARSERERLWAGGDLTALACELGFMGADPELVEAINGCAQALPANRQAPNPFADMNRADLLSSMSLMSSPSLGEIMLAMRAAAPLILDDLVQHGFLGELDGELPKTDAEWIAASVFGGFPSAMISAIDSARREAILALPSSTMLALLHESLPHLDDEDEPAMATEEERREILDARGAIERAFAAHSSWPSNMPQLVGLPAKALVVAKALIAGSQNDLSAGEALASLDNECAPWRLCWTIASKKAIARVVSASDNFTRDARSQFISALSGRDLYEGMMASRRMG